MFDFENRMDNIEGLGVWISIPFFSKSISPIVKLANAQEILEMIDSCEGGKIVAKELIAYLYEHYRSLFEIRVVLHDIG